MINKSLLKQALKLKNPNTTYSKIEKLCKEANKYQLDNDVVFLYAKYRQKVEVLNEEVFFEFISESIIQKSGVVKSFEDIEQILDSKTRKENIESSGDSKNSIVKVFDRVVVFQVEDENPILYQKIEDIPVNGTIVAVENGETFLKINSLFSKYGFKNYLYLSGFANTLTREFLKDKNVVFFLDFDIEAIRIYDSFECKEKSFFKPEGIEKYFNSKSANQKLYLKQRASLINEHRELQWLIDLIKNNSTVVEQEVIE